MKTYDLTTTATANVFARIKRADSEAAIRVPILVSAMSKAIGRYTQRQFIGLNDPTAPGGAIDVGAEVARRYEYDGSGYLSLAPYEARSISAITLDGDALTERATGGALDSDEYLPRPLMQTPEGTYLSLALPESNCGSIVEVTGLWGIVDVPADVELACLHAVSDGYRNPEGVPSRSIGDGLILGEDSDEGGSLPRAARALLSPLCRP